MSNSSFIFPTRFSVFVTGTGTGVGKTVVSTALAGGLADAGFRPTYWKPVQTGNGESDSETIRGLLGERVAVVPEAASYALPASPDQAAAAEGATAPSVDLLVREFASIPRSHVVVEGAGGLLVPLNEQNETWVDFLQQTRIPALVVASTGLGTLNHTLLTIEALQRRAIDVLGIVLSGPAHAANEKTLRRMLPNVAITTLRPLPIGDGFDALTNDCRALAEFVLQQVERRKDRCLDDEWLKADAAHVWHPYTQHKTAAAPLAIARARGIYLETPNGERLVDGASSWWVNTIGHGRNEIAAAIAEQQQKLDHVLFAGTAHEPAARLAERLAALAGYGLQRTFYSDNGSTAVEVALKMAYQSWVNRGDTGRRLFVSFTGSYHGDTFGAMAVAAADGFHGVFKPLFFETLRAPIVTAHKSALCPAGRDALQERLRHFHELLSDRGHEICGVILEPLLQGSAGMLVQPPEFVQEIAQICKIHGIPLILDEVFTGLGRCGARFAFDRLGITPDIVCAAKGLTGGSLPLAVTLAREEFFDAFLRDDKAKALLHGHSFTGNPIACNAALASLAIMEREDLPGRAREMERLFYDWIRSNDQHLRLENARALGGVMAFELPGSGLGDYFHPKAAAIPATGRRYGLFLRPLGNTLYFLPPLTISPGELEWCLGQLERVVGDLA